MSFHNHVCPQKDRFSTSHEDSFPFFLTKSEFFPFLFLFAFFQDSSHGNRQEMWSEGAEEIRSKEPDSQESTWKLNC